MSGGELAGRTAIVTGGGWNIGRAVALAFAAAGANVVVASRDRARLDATADAIRARGGAALAVPTDVTDAAQVDALVAAALARFGAIDVVAALAGGGCTFQDVDAMDPRVWDAVVRQNLTGTFHCARAVLPHFRARDRGVLITCSGGGAAYPVLGAKLNAYACAKAAICRFTDQLTAELWHTGIRVNCMDPGMVWSPDTLALIEAEEARTGAPHPNRAVNRPPEDAAELALWLASDRSHEIRGRVVCVNDAWWRDPAEVTRVATTVHLYRLRRVEE